MIKNYLLITLRNFVKNRNHTLLNVLGLSVGITACVTIFLIIMYEWRFDRFHHAYDRIQRVVLHADNEDGVEYGSAVPYPFMEAFRNDFSDVPLATELHYTEDGVLTVGADKIKIDNIIFADSLFFSVFDFGVQSGSPRADLGKPGMAFVTQSLAEKLGFNGNATTLKLDSKLELQVAGIVNDPPPNSHINFSLIVSMPSLSSDFLGGLPLTEWGMTMAGLAYIVLPEHQESAPIEARLKAFGEKYFEADDAARKSFHLQPLSDIHFNEQYALNAGDRPNVVKERLGIMAMLGLVILAVACINFVNLATAMAVNKSKEIGVRKTLGAQRKQLIAYFLTESCVMTVLAVVVSLCFAEWLLPWLNNFLEKQMDLDVWTDNALQLFVLTLVVVTSLLSGLYPAIVLSGYQPVAVLKNKLSVHRRSGVGLRKVLVVFQFLVVQVLVVSTVVIGNQMNYLRGKPLGYNTEAVINVAVPAREADKLAAFRTRMEANPDVIAMSYGLGAPTSENALTTSYYLTEKGKSGTHNMVNLKPVDSRYLDTYGLKLIAGRWFTETDEQLADLSRPETSQVFVYIINETTMRSLGARTPDEILGKHVTTGVNSIEGEVIGVVADFHDASLHEAISPVIFMNFPFFYYDAGIKVKTTGLQTTIADIEKQWTALFPELYFQYEFLDDHLANLYRQDDRIYSLFQVFAAISIFIGCLGLYGLIAFMAHQKVKEIGVRKVFGASVQSIVLLFSKEFIQLMAFAFLIAAPLSWYAMTQWLQDFEFRSAIPLWAFGAGGLATLLLTLLTVGYRSVRAAQSNPVDTLRSE